MSHPFNELGGESGGESGGWVWLPQSRRVVGANRALIGAELPGWSEIFEASKTPVVLGTKFPDGGWDPFHKARAIAAAFAATGEWRNDCDPGRPNDTKAKLIAEITALRKHSRDSGHQNEEKQRAIREQAVDISPYWANLLACSAASRPATWSLVLIGLQVGALVASHFKLKYMRARPAQVWPALAPQIATPAHPSYPSAHALQSYLIAACVEWAAPAMGEHCKLLANDIALNREIAGVHFPSDSQASRDITGKVMPILRRMKEVGRIRAAAAAEWAGADAIAFAVPPEEDPAA